MQRREGEVGEEDLPPGVAQGEVERQAAEDVEPAAGAGDEDTPGPVEGGEEGLTEHRRSGLAGGRVRGERSGFQPPCALRQPGPEHVQLSLPPTGVRLGG